MTNLLTKIKKSIFLKFFLIFIAAYVFITIATVITFEYVVLDARQQKVENNLANYCNYLASEIGSPPDTTIAANIANEFDMQIVLSSDHIEWKSDNEIFEIDHIKMKPLNNNSKCLVGFELNRGFIIQIQKLDCRFLFVVNSEIGDLTAEKWIYRISIFTIMTLVILGLYFIVRRQLIPIKSLHESVSQVGDGNLDYKTTTNRTDELGVLIDSFNAMTQRIRTAITAREQLLLDVSHELRSPLTRMKVAIEFMDDGTTKKSIIDDIVEMETMITELLESQRLESEFGKLKLSRTDISSIVRELSKESTDSKPGLKLLSLPDEVFLMVEPERIRLMFNNIVSNALKYSDSDGLPVEISIREKQDEVIIIVQDFGKGIPEKEIPFIYEPFYRVDKSRSKETGGYGLGLSLCKRIIEAHGGEISISSKLGSGTSVYIKFNRS